MPPTLVHSEAPPDGFMRFTLVGSGAASGVPVMGHFSGNGCACEEAIAHPMGPDARNVASLLITVPLRLTQAAEMAEAEREADAMKADEKGQSTRDDTREHDASKEAAAAASSPTSAKPAHNNFTSPLFNTLRGRKVFHVMVDCGKTFRDAYFRILTRENLRSLDALFFTTGKPSAISGVDDLRDLQSMESTPDGEWLIHHYIPTYVLPQTKRDLHGTVKYIMNNSIDMGPSHSTRTEYEKAWEAVKQQREAARPGKAWNNIGIRRSAALQLMTVSDFLPTPLYVPSFDDLPVYALPLYCQGREKTEMRMLDGTITSNEMSMGLVIGRGARCRKSTTMGMTPRGDRKEDTVGGSCAVYLSHVSHIPEATMEFLEDLAVIDVLFIDCLHGPGIASEEHYCMDEVAELAARLLPKRLITTGMSCDVLSGEGQRQLDHAVQRAIARRDCGENQEHGTCSQRSPSIVDVAIGYDGLVVELPM